MIEIGKSGLLIDGGNKGNLDLYFRPTKIFGKYIHYQGTEVDCTGELFKFLKESAPFKEDINKERFLRNHEHLIKEAFKKQKRSHYYMVECYKCGVDRECCGKTAIDEEDGVEYDICPPMGVDADWDKQNDSASRIMSLKADDYVYVANTSPIPLKDFDLRSEYVYGLHMVCKIKSIKNPIVKHGNYYQECVFCDDNTSKTIDAELQNNVADFDKWNKGDKVELYGVYKGSYLAVTTMELLEETEIEEIITSNRNQETPGYNDWRKKIIGRDGKCVCCGHDKHLEAHHLFGYKENPNLAVNEYNGVTLCKFCHDKYHSVYGLKDINPVDFMNFIKRFGVR